MVLDALKKHLGQPMTLQQMAEVQNCRLVRRLAQTDTDKMSHLLNLIQYVFGSRITEIVEELHTMRAQHGLQPIGRSPRLALLALVLKVRKAPLHPSPSQQSSNQDSILTTQEDLFRGSLGHYQILYPMDRSGRKLDGAVVYC